jgi:hypothetical protein
MIMAKRMKISDATKIRVAGEYHVPSEAGSGPTPVLQPADMASGFTPGLPKPTPMCDPAKEAAQHVPPTPK